MLNKTKIEDLKSVSLFRPLAPNELQSLAGKLEERDYRKGEPIYQEGDRPDRLYVILAGKVEISKKAPAEYRQVIAMLPPGRFFGELAFFENRPHSARAQAVEDARLVTLDRAAFDNLEKDQPQLVHTLLRQIVLVLSANMDSMNDMFLHMVHYAFYGEKGGGDERAE
jgi:CRP/FNR family transcriptional regulator, cyclic AMP receptor protein